jgi:hypothetical protein
MSNHEDEEDQHLATLDELEATQAQINSYQTLLKDLPEIFERKFNDRLQPILDRQHQLLQERELLLDRLHQQLPEGFAPPDAGVLPPPPSALPAGGPLATTLSRRGWGRRFGWLVCVALLGGLIGVQVSQHLGKRSGPPSMGLRDGRGDPPGWERQTTRDPAAADPTPAMPETAPE